MKTLLLIRHAKSSWNNALLSDFERPLNDRGKHDAPIMAKKIKSKKINIDLFISSPAKRAKKTAEFFLSEFNENEKKLVFAKQLYEAGVSNFYNVIENLDEEFNTIALFAHNPGITDFINSLEIISIDEMPTCGTFALKVLSGKWKNFKASKKEFLFFDYPKNEEV